MATKVWSRRQFLAAATAALAAPASLATASPATATALLLSACDNAIGQHFVHAMTLTGQIRWQLPLSERAHAIAQHPQRPLAAVFARRPGTTLTLLNAATGTLLEQRHSVAGRHFYGHGCFSRDGNVLYCTENAYTEKQGVIGIYQIPSLTRLGELPSYGLGPHELVLHPQYSQLVVANGGILTHPDLPRRKLNLASMAASLAYVDLDSGALCQQLTLPNAKSSIRHLAINAAGQVGLALQQQDTREAPLVAFQQGETPIQVAQTTAAVWHELRGYTASICLADTVPIAAVTCPRGNRVTFWDVEARAYLGALPITDAGGVVYEAAQNAFWVTTGTGEVLGIPLRMLTIQQRFHHAAVRWDNHATLMLSTVAS